MSLPWPAVWRQALATADWEMQHVAQVLLKEVTIIEVVPLENLRVGDSQTGEQLYQRSSTPLPKF